MYKGLVAALIISFVMTLVTVLVFRRRGPWGSAWSLFLVLFLALWAVAIYIAPVGPVVGGIAWLPIMVAGILLGLLLIGSMPDANHLRDKEMNTSMRPEIRDVERQSPISKLFWIFIILLSIAIFIGMMNPQKAM